VEEPVRTEQARTDGPVDAVDGRRPASGLAHDHVERGHVVERQLRLDGDVDGTLADEHVRPEVAERTGAPDRTHDVAELQAASGVDPAVQRRVRQERVRQRAHLRDPHRRRVHQRLAGVRATIRARPPAPAQQGSADDAYFDPVLDHQCDQRGPGRYATDEVGGAVDRVDDPAARAPAGVLALFAVDGVAGTAPRQGATDRLLDGGVGIRHLGQVGLALDAQVLSAEPSESDRVGVVGEHVRQAEIVREFLAGSHGSRLPGSIGPQRDLVR